MFVCLPITIVCLPKTIFFAKNYLFAKNDRFVAKNVFQVSSKYSQEIILGEPVLRWAFWSRRWGITFKIMTQWVRLIIALLCLNSLQARFLSDSDVEIWIYSETMLPFGKESIAYILKMTNKKVNLSNFSNSHPLQSIMEIHLDFLQNEKNP